MISWKHRLLLAAGTLGLATWLGYRGECHVMDAAGSKPVTFQSVVRRVMAPKSRNEHIDRLNRIRHSAGRTYANRRETTEAWEIIRAFTIEDVKAGLAEIPRKPERQANEMLTEMLFYRWAQMDPEAAVREAVQPGSYGESYSAISSVATAWADRDPEGALRWAANSQSDMAKHMIGSAAGRALALRSPEDALAKAITEFPSALDDVIFVLARKSADTEEARRKQLSELTTLPEQRPRQLYVEQLFSNALRQGPEKAGVLVDELERAGVPAEEIGRFRAQLAVSSTPYSFRARMEHLAAPESKSIDQQLQSYYADWASNEPAQAAAWAEETGRTGFVEDAVKTQAKNLLRSVWQPGGGTSFGLGEKGIVTQYASWQKLDAPAAEAWLRTMPADIRNHLSRNHAAR
ncbi:hypothetical protein [Luteolibacter sp. Populi]|uniref:hypothetical protein n=1 Tax=Luteolibacter sp. Populi TaxID=3230487 RepID=UPI0034677859